MQNDSIDIQDDINDSEILEIGEIKQSEKLEDLRMIIYTSWIV